MLKHLEEAMIRLATEAKRHFQALEPTYTQIALCFNYKN